LKGKLKNVIAHLKSKEASYGDVRYVSSKHQSISVMDQTAEAISLNENVGVGIRVIVDGCWGFAATSGLGDDDLIKTANLALKIARASAMTKKEDVHLAEIEPYKDTYRTAVIEDPFAVSLDRKLSLLFEITRVLKANKQIKIARAGLDFYRTKKLFYSTEGAAIQQEIVESGGGYEATAVGGGEAQRRSYPNSHRGDYGCAGYEFIRSMNMLEHAERVADEAAALIKAKDCPSGEKTLIIMGSQMALQVHESCGHPTELDRVLGTEISLAGGSFMTLDQLGKLQYGSPLVNIVADATIKGGLGSFGYDDEGAKACRSYLIREGRHVGYQTSRETAPLINAGSNGCMRADGWNNIPLIRMTNINLEPGQWELNDLIADTKDGLLLDMNKTWSIDDRRLNFQFGCEIAWEIKNGKIGQMHKNPVYTGITPEFWKSCDAICNKNHWHVWGIPSCGKGEPMQTAHVAHGTSPARFKNVTVGAGK
jgi:TldD protein